MKMAQTMAHPLKMKPVPNLFCKGGKARSIHNAWLPPPMARKSAIRWSENPKPPRLTLVYIKRGKVAVNIRPRRPTWPNMYSTVGTPGDLRTCQVDSCGSGFDSPGFLRARVSFRKKTDSKAEERTTLPAM